jgi:hypothetical protein
MRSWLLDPIGSPINNAALMNQPAHHPPYRMGPSDGGESAGNVLDLSYRLSAFDIQLKRTDYWLKRRIVDHVAGA